MGTPRLHKLADDFAALRLRVLATAPNDAPEPDTAASYLRGCRDAVFASLALQRATQRPLIQPRGGFARFDDQRKLTRALADADADFIPLTIDSHTRHNDYRTAQILLERSETEGLNLLNGFPLVNHGYSTSRLLYEDIDRPISLRHGTPDARLLVEVALATGITEIEGGPLCYTLPYARSYPLQRALLHWQYVDRLCALHSTRERPIHRESFGVLSATMVPPAIVAVVELCEMLLACEQGVTSFALSFGQTGSLPQDIALMRVLRNAAPSYLARFGFRDVHTHFVFHQWMGAFPYDFERASALIVSSAQIACLVGADKVVVKTKEEARGIPSVQSNVEATRLVAYVRGRTAQLPHLNAPEVDEEIARIRLEVDQIMEAIFALPQAKFWSSLAEAVRLGIIDVPFTPHEDNRNALVTSRGRSDGIYIVEPGAVPLPSSAVEAERRLAQERRDSSSNDRAFQRLMRDINLMNPA